MKRLLRAIAHAPILLAALLADGGLAAAQEFAKVDEAAREQLPAVPFVGVAYGVIWAGVLVYVLILARRIAAVQGALENVRRRLVTGAADGAGPSGAIR